MSPTETTRRTKPRKRNGFVRPEVVLSGYYGFNNLGDELILQVLIQELKKRDADITVLSADVQGTMERYGVKAVHRLKIPDIVQALVKADLFISGGGGLFQDTTGMGSVVYYGGLIEMAHQLKIPTAFIGQGVGPLRRKSSQMLFKRFVQHCDVVTVRDQESADLVYTLTELEPIITADPVWLLDLPPVDHEKPLHGHTDTWNIALSLRPWITLTDARLRSLAKFFADLIRGSSRTIHFYLLVLQPDMDEAVLQRFEELLYEDLRQMDSVTLQYIQPEQVLAAIQHSHVLFGMRFHSLVAGLLAGVPVYGLSYDPKVSSLIAQLDLAGTDVSRIEDMHTSDIQHYFANYAYPDLSPLRSRAVKNFEALDGLLASAVNKQLAI